MGPCESVERVPEERAKLEEPCVRADMEIEQDSAGGHEKGPELRSQVEHEGEPVVTTEVLGLVKKPQGAKKKLTKLEKKIRWEEKVKVTERLRKAAIAWGTGKYSSIAICAKEFQVNRKHLHKGVMQTGGLFPGSGQFSKILSKEEEGRIAAFVKYSAQIGYGLSWPSLRLVVQELLLSLKSANPSRITGLEDHGQLPSRGWVRRFAERHNLSLRKSSTISKGRAIVSQQDIQLWFRDMESRVVFPDNSIEASF